MYVTSAVLIVLSCATADDSWADCRERSRLGMAIVAMIRMMATTISSSSNENPLCLIWLLVASCEPVAIIITTGPNCSWNYCTGLPDKVPGKQGVHVPVVVV